MGGRTTFDTITDYLRTDWLTGGDPVAEHVMLGLYRLVSGGTPVAVEDLAVASGVALDQVREIVERIEPSRLQIDADGRIVAFAGLSQHPTAHRFEFDGRVLFTWCAFDALFLPDLLEGVARVASTCPVTGTDIRLTVSGEGVERDAAAGAVMSFVMPDAEKRGRDLRGAFCNHVHFFASREAGDAWQGRHPEASILSLDEAFALGRIRNQVGFRHAMAGRGARSGEGEYPARPSGRDGAPVNR